MPTSENPSREWVEKHAAYLERTAIFPAKHRSDALDELSALRANVAGLIRFALAAEPLLREFRCKVADTHYHSFWQTDERKKRLASIDALLATKPWKETDDVQD